MANIAVEREGGGERSLSRRREGWDPFRAMREVMRWDPFGEGSQLGFGLAPWLERAETGLAAPFDVKETKDAFELCADVPGVTAKDLDIKLTNNRLTVSGKREAEKTDKGDTYYSYERSYGSFSRSFTLPEEVNTEAIHADLKDGVLKVVLPKKPETKPRQVEVSAT